MFYLNLCYKITFMNTRERKRRIEREGAKILAEYAKVADKFMEWMLHPSTEYNRLYQHFHEGWQKRTEFINKTFKLKFLEADPKWFHDDFHPEEEPFKIKFNPLGWFRKRLGI